MLLRGASLSPQIGSISHTSSRSTYTNAYYDKTVSPNYVETVDRIRLTPTGDVYGKTTSEMFTAFAAGDTNWTQTAGVYPRLTWTTPASLAASPDSSQPYFATYKALVENFAAISTLDWLTVSSTNSWGSAYQMKTGYGGPSAINVSGLSVDSGTSASSGFSSTTFIGAFNSGAPLGSIWKNDITFTLGGMPFSFSVIRKTLFAVNQSATPNVIPTLTEFLSFLDVAQRAGGAYNKGVFTISAASLDLSSAVFTPYTYDKNNHIFSALLTGNGTVISGLSLTGTAMPLFGTLYYGEIDGLTFNGPVFGTQASPILGGSNVSLGMLFDLTSAGKISNITMTAPSVYITDPVARLTYFGLITGNSQNTTVFLNILIDNPYITLSVVQINSTGGIGTICGQLVGSITNSNVRKGRFYVVYSTLNTTLVSYHGGIVGLAAGGSSITGCSYTGELYGMRVGGLVGRSSGVAITKSYFAGHLSRVPNLTRVATINTLYGGGLIAHVSSGTTNLSECFAFIDMSDFAFAGGLTGYQSTAFNISNCYVNGASAAL